MKYFFLDHFTYLLKFMNKKGLIEKLSYKFQDVDKEDLAKVVTLFFEIIKKNLKEGRRVELRDFGIFQLVKSKGNFFKNPKNHQKYYIKEKIRVLFKTGREFKKRLNTPFLASLDLGTQTFRLCLGKCYQGKLYFLLKKRENVRLGEGLAEKGMILETAFERGLMVLENFKKIIEKYRVSYYKALGTAVFRRAQNAKFFIEKAKEKTGIEIEVLSPEEEAKLSLEGVILGLKEIFSQIENFLLIDVGGGSSEFIYFQNGETWFKSLDLGVVVLKELFDLRYPVSSKILKSIKEYIREKLFELPVEKPSFIIITGGTASILGSLDLKLSFYIPEKLHGHQISKERLEKLIQKLASLSLLGIKKVKGMEEGREDIVLPGLLIYSEVLDYFNQSTLYISEYGILEGSLLSLTKEYNL